MVVKTEVRKSWNQSIWKCSSHVHGNGYLLLLCGPSGIGLVQCLLLLNHQLISLSDSAFQPWPHVGITWGFKRLMPTSHPQRLHFLWSSQVILAHGQGWELLLVWTLAIRVAFELAASGITWQLVRNVESQASSQRYQIKISILARWPEDVCTLKSEESQV